MATLYRNAATGEFRAEWTDSNGRRVIVGTGETLEQRAHPKAARLEAEARFWEDHAAGTWHRLADAPFSPRYCHRVSTYCRHLPFPRFRALLREAGVKFRSSAACLDHVPKPSPRAKRWLYRGRRRTFSELLECAVADVTPQAVRSRINAGWPLEKALGTPNLSRAEAGRMGAEIANARRARG